MGAKAQKGLLCVCMLIAAGICLGLIANHMLAERGLKQKEYAEIFKEYQDYGLMYDMESNRLYFHGELVRYFEDIIDENHYKVWPSRDGDVDVYAVRDEFSGLTGVQKADAQSFATRTTALQSTTLFELQIVESIGMNGYTNEIEALVKERLDATYAVYQEYGLAYDRHSNRLYYDGELVGYFEDEANGNSFGPYDDSEIEIYAVRNQLGHLTGLSLNRP